MAAIGDYWDKEIISEVVALLKEYTDLFPQCFTEMKGIKGERGDIIIELKPDRNLHESDRTD